MPPIPQKPDQTGELDQERQLQPSRNLEGRHQGGQVRQASRRGRRQLLRELSGLWAAACLLAEEGVAEQPEAEQAGHHHHGALQIAAAAPYRFRFFTPAEQPVLRQLLDLLIPADERSGGALGAKVDEYIDRVLAGAAVPLQRSWRSGLKSYAGKTAAEAEALLRKAAENEFSPKSAADGFFVLLKSAAVDGFYTSREGITRELGYRGYTFLREFPGWTGGELSRPANFVPKLRQRG